MPEFLAFGLATLLLFGVVALQFSAIFEPYRTVRTPEGLGWVRKHCRDLKLIRIARWWADTLFASQNEAEVFEAALLHELGRHRFLVGEDAHSLQYSERPSPALRRALESSALTSNVTNAHPITMSITPRRVEAGGHVVWWGQPLPYESRFGDFPDF